MYPDFSPTLGCYGFLLAVLLVKQPVRVLPTVFLQFRGWYGVMYGKISKIDDLALWSWFWLWIIKFECCKRYFDSSQSIHKKIWSCVNFETGCRNKIGIVKWSCWAYLTELGLISTPRATASTRVFCKSPVGKEGLQSTTKNLNSLQCCRR
jgi:hypothetical protein